MGYDKREGSAGNDAYANNTPGDTAVDLHATMTLGTARMVSVSVHPQATPIAPYEVPTMKARIYTGSVARFQTNITPVRLEDRKIHPLPFISVRANIDHPRMLKILAELLQFGPSKINTILLELTMSRNAAAYENAFVTKMVL